jgi:hypothetical protein
MSLFSLADIKITNKIRSLSSPNALAAAFGQRGYNVFRYPIDVGDTDKGHYMMIYINTQKQSEYKFQVSSDLPTVLENRTGGGGSISQSPQYVFSNAINAAGTQANIGLNALGSVFSQISPATGLISSLVSQISQSATTLGLSGTRTIQRTTDAIALYTPDTLTFTQNQNYSDLSLSGFLAAGASTLGSLDDLLKNAQAMSSMDPSGAKGFLNNVSPFIAYALRGSDLGRSLFTTVTGKVVNPLLDMIYTSPEFRNFRFEFMFYPRSVNEAKNVQDIIQKLKFHQAPEIDTRNSGFFMIPPSEFDIKFYYNGVENPNIPKISTCVLTSIDVDYAPNGFTAYELPNEPKPEYAKTGMPVAIRLSLQFKETEILTKRYFEKEPEFGVFPVIV